jgi:predicted ATPase
VKSKLPIALSSFLGRESELTEITTLLPQERLITQPGAGGVGKSRTALQIAAAVVATQPDGV